MIVSSPMDGAALGHEFPASAAQLCQLQAGSAFGAAQVLTLRGSVDAEALERSLLRLRRRHEVLRTVLRKKDGAWRQMVLDQDAPDAEERTDASDGSWFQRVEAPQAGSDIPRLGSTASSGLDELARRLAEACSDETGALFRVAMVCISAQEHACIFAASSLVLDSLSFEILLAELRTLYAYESRAAGSPPPEPELQYADCVLWEQAMAGSREPAAFELSPDEARISPVRLSAPVFHDQALSQAAAEQLLPAGTQASAALLLSIAAALPLSATGAGGSLGLLASGRTLGELESTLGPLQQALSAQIATSLGVPAALLVPEAEKAVARARAQARFGAPAEQPRPAFLLVETPLELQTPFAPGIKAFLGSLAAFPQAGPVEAPSSGHNLAVRLLLGDSAGEIPALRLGLWSWSMTQETLAQLASRVASNLDHLVLRAEEPFPAAASLGSESPGSDLPARSRPESRLRPFDSGSGDTGALAASAPAGTAQPVPHAPETEVTALVMPEHALPGPTSRGDAPQGEIETTLAAIWSAVLQVPSVGRHEDFFDLGGHSLLAVRIGTRIENAFGKEIPLNAILEKPTIAEFATLLQQAPLADQASTAAEVRRHRLVPIQEPKQDVAARTPLFWIPGGRAISVLALREVSLLLGPDRPVYGVESRLPEQGEGFLSVPVRAEQYIQLLRERQPHGPYLLAGFCVGGMVAFEMAQQFRQQGEEVGFLGLLQASMPGFPASPALRRKMERQRQVYLARTMTSFLLLRVSPWHRRTPREAQQKVLDRFAKILTGWVGTSSQLPEVTQQSNGQTMKSYRPTNYPGAVHIFLAEDCFESAGMEPALDPRRAWTQVAGGGAEIVVVPGDHVSMLSQAPARALAEAMRAVLPA